MVKRNGLIIIYHLHYVEVHMILYASFLSQQSPCLMWHINEDTTVGAWLPVLDHAQWKFLF